MIADTINYKSHFTNININNYVEKCINYGAITCRTISTTIKIILKMPMFEESRKPYRFNFAL